MVEIYIQSSIALMQVQRPASCYIRSDSYNRGNIANILFKLVYNLRMLYKYYMIDYDLARKVVKQYHRQQVMNHD